MKVRAAYKISQNLYKQTIDKQKPSSLGILAYFIMLCNIRRLAKILGKFATTKDNWTTSIYPH